MPNKKYAPRDVKLYSGYYWSEKNQDSIFYESTYEYKTIRMLEDNPSVLGYERCPIHIKVQVSNIDGSPRVFRYNPDFLVTFSNGSQYIIEVKAKGLMFDFFVKSKIAAGFELTKYLNFGYLVWTEKELNINGKKELRKWFFKETGKTPPGKV